MNFFTRSANTAQAYGFAKYNNGEHLCVQLDENPHHTISVVTRFGKRITFAFLNWKDEDSHVECVDIQHHSDRRNDGGVPLQRVCVRGQGPVLFVSGEEEATLTIIDLKD